MQDVKFEIKAADGEKQHVIHHYTGTLPNPVNPKEVEVIGDINAVRHFLKHRVSTINKDASVIVIDVEKGEIELRVDHHLVNKLTVEGKVTFSEDFKLIKTAMNVLSHDKMVDFLRKNRFLFADKSDYNTVVDKMKSFDVNVQQKYSSAKNVQTGNRSLSSSQQTDFTSFNFSVVLPIFKSSAPVKFIVEMCCDWTDNGPVFWLESLDLEEIRRNALEAIIAENVKELEGHCISIVYS